MGREPDVSVFRPITPDCPAAAGEASAANEHARFRSVADPNG